MQVKVYIVQRADGEVVGAKLTFDAAHRLALAEAPAEVLYSEADKTPAKNVSAYKTSHTRVQSIANPPRTVSV